MWCRWHLREGGREREGGSNLGSATHLKCTIPREPSASERRHPPPPRPSYAYYSRGQKERLLYKKHFATLILNKTCSSVDGETVAMIASQHTFSTRFESFTQVLRCVLLKCAECTQPKRGDIPRGRPTLPSLCLAPSSTKVHLPPPPGVQLTFAQLTILV